MTNEIDVTHIRNLDVTANPAAVSLTAIGAVLRPFELEQCRGLWGRLYGPRDGIPLRGSRPHYWGAYGVEEEQHVRVDHIPVFRVFLSELCWPSGSPETWTRDSRECERYGGLFCDLGTHYVRLVHRFAQNNLGIETCPWPNHLAARPAGDWCANRECDGYHGCWL